ncbi:hypothetical protein EVJ20_09510 [Exiguobacterium sp. SH0S1]|uniref:hypothetical protein n=1 Tax=Exiguobacterium sp. SH0S1 TaxID=2510949 RepID=UPI0010401EC0|nr:hypothetical protein [Exiguobacterium sp. SH0S1]TCI76947.1 hypothetical protein EVJ20_09510 [Exiguobacterium sp. SH0S1]
MLFEKNKLYKRSVLHDQYGGSRQRGISTPNKHKLIFIFDSGMDEEFGYKNGWSEDDGLYYYSGEGQEGNQSFSFGNKALLNHIENGEDVYLFESLGKGSYRFVDQLILIGYDIQFGIDKHHNQREVIVFAFEPLHVVQEEAHHFASTMRYKTVEELNEIALRDPKRATGLSMPARKLQVREQTAALYYAVLARANNCCEACGNQAPFETEEGPYLELHSLYKESDDGLSRPDQVAALCSNCHARMHKGKDGADYNKQLIHKLTT